MKLTKSKLKRLIKEELQNVLMEQQADPCGQKPLWPGDAKASIKVDPTKKVLADQRAWYNCKKRGKALPGGYPLAKQNAALRKQQQPAASTKGLKPAPAKIGVTPSSQYSDQQLKKQGYYRPKKTAAPASTQQSTKGLKPATAATQKTSKQAPPQTKGTTFTKQQAIAFLKEFLPISKIKGRSGLRNRSAMLHKHNVREMKTGTIKSTGNKAWKINGIMVNWDEVVASL